MEGFFINLHRNLSQTPILLTMFPTKNRHHSFIRHFMIQSLLLLLLLMGSVVMAQEQTTYYLIRHAEKNRSNSENPNPHLTELGLQRAKRWKNVLQHIPFDRIYSTSFHRTVETALPISKERNLPITYYDSKELYNKDFAKANHGKTVLVVGHSNTTPQLVNKILQQERYPEIPDSLNGRLYIVTLRDQKAFSQLLSIE